MQAKQIIRSRHHRRERNEPKKSLGLGFTQFAFMDYGFPATQSGIMDQRPENEDPQCLLAAAVAVGHGG